MFFAQSTSFCDYRKHNVSQKFINKLAGLPFFASLTLDGGSYKDDQLVLSAGGFHSLRRLTVDLDELKKLEIHMNQHCPSLQTWLF